jgi:hypothetical protein
VLLGQSREARAIFLMVAILLGFTLAVLGSGHVSPSDFGQLVSLYLAGSFVLWFITGLVAVFVLLIVNFPKNGLGKSPTLLIFDQLKSRWHSDRLLSFIWPPILFAVLMASYNAYKQMILVGHPFRYDGLFTQADRILFLGHDPWRVVHQLFPGTGAANLIDSLYHGWYAPMSLGVILCAWMPGSTWRLRTQYLLTYLGVWIGMGCFIATAFPAAGPVFVPLLIDPHSGFAELTSTLKAMQPTIEMRALALQGGLMESYGTHQLAVGAGISALPSVHNALAMLFTLAAFRLNKVAGWIMAAYAAFIWLGSIFLGWHYAIDGIVSLLLILPLWHFAGRVADWLETAPSILQPQPTSSPSFAN